MADARTRACKSACLIINMHKIWQLYYMTVILCGNGSVHERHQPCPAPAACKPSHATWVGALALAHITASLCALTFTNLLV